MKILLVATALLALCGCASVPRSDSGLCGTCPVYPLRNEVYNSSPDAREEVIRYANRYFEVANKGAREPWYQVDEFSNFVVVRVSYENGKEDMYMVSNMTIEHLLSDRAARR
jgi:hypothetical protein